MNHRPIKLPYNWQDVGGQIALEEVQFPSHEEIFDRSMPPEYLQRRRQELRSKFALMLLEAIEQSKYPVVVEFDEDVKLKFYNGDWMDVYKLAARLTPTQTRQVIFTSPQEIGFYPFKNSKPTTFKSRLKFLFSGNRQDLK